MPQIRTDYIGRLLSDLLFPPRCPGCGELIRFEYRFSYYKGTPEYKSFIHKKCRKKIRFITGSFCRRCGTPIPGGSQLCRRCEDGRRSFDEGRSVMVYENEMRAAIAQVKYHSNKEYCGFFAFAAAKELESWIREKRIDCIVPVPVHPRKRRERGYNQAEVIAELLSEYTGIPMRTDVLIRKVDTKAQKELTPDERRMNLIGAFGIRKMPDPGCAVLLVDDILTTGATMDICAMTLKTEGGAGTVYVLSILAAGHSEPRPDGSRKPSGF